MKVLITGANGFVGKEAVKQLAKQHNVLPTDIQVTKRIQYLDITNFDICLKLFSQFSYDDGKTITIKTYEKPDVVVHLAAMVAGKPSIMKPHPYYYVNIVGALNVLEAMRQVGLKHLVYVSSWSTYGSDVELPIDENTIQQPENPYGVSKYCAEQIVKNYAELYGIKTVILRPTMIYGANQPEKNVVQQVVDCMVSGDTFEVYGSGEHTREFLHVKDAGNAICKAVDYVKTMSRPCEVFVLGTGKPIPIKTLVFIAQNIKQFPVVFKESKKWAFSQASNIKKAKRLFGWNPVISLVQGLREVWEWRKRENYKKE